MSALETDKDEDDRCLTDEPLIALTQQCGGDLTKVMTAFFSFLHRRTDFYCVAHEDDWKQGKAKMGFRPGDAERLLLASFRQFPLHRIPPQPTSKQRPTTTTAAAITTTSSSSSSTTTTTAAATSPVESSTGSSSTTNKPDDSLERRFHRVRLNEKGLQIPVGNGGTTARYTWTQTLDECTVLIPVPIGLRAKDLHVVVKSASLSIRSKQQQPDSTTAVSIQGEWVAPIVPDESTWTLEGGVLVLTLHKKVKTFWDTILQGDDKIDTSLVDSRRHISDYDECTQAQIRKLIHQQRQELQQQTNSIPAAAVAAAQPLTPDNIPPGAEYIDAAKLASISSAKK